MMFVGVYLLFSYVRVKKIANLEKARYLAEYGEFVRDYYADSDNTFLKMMVLKSHQGQIRPLADRKTYAEAIERLYKIGRHLIEEEQDQEIRKKYRKVFSEIGRESKSSV